MESSSIAICVPCLNEATTVERVIGDFVRALPSATVYVIDNGSTDDTARLAEHAGARVIAVPERGKGRAVRAIFERIDADVYVMVDGDGTYPAAAISRLIAPVLDASADMVVGSRLRPGCRSRFSWSHRFGNRAFAAAVNFLFGATITDLLSGYRAFSRDFAQRTLLDSTGFEIETELTLRALIDGRRIREIAIDLGVRPSGSSSKLRAIHDGLRILRTIIQISSAPERRELFLPECA